MSQKRFPNKTQQKRSKQVPHSQKSAVSAQESYASREKAARLTTQLHDTASKADWAQNRSDFHWRKAREYEAQGRIKLALEQDTLSQFEGHRADCYRTEIKQIEKMIDELSLVYSVRHQKVKQGRKKVSEPAE